ncbi:MAG: hypothetical protein NTZ77_02855 [Caldiserica bacterium]|nr:hypothetical protein [Caldisericota bacterium]
MNKILLSTGNIKENYEIVDIIFAAQVIRSHLSAQVAGRHSRSSPRSTRNSGRQQLKRAVMP